MRNAEKAAALLIVLFGVWFLLMALTTSFQGTQSNRILLVELGGDAASLQLAVQADGRGDASGIAHNMQMVVRNTYMDFVLIPLYWAMFLALAYLAGLLGKRMLAFFVAVCITGAAIADLLEDQAILVAMHVRNFTDAVAVDIQEYSQAKWGFFFLAAILLGGAIVLNRHTSMMRRAAGGAFLACGVVGTIGIARYRISLDFCIAMINFANALLAVALLLTLWKLVQSVRELQHAAHRAHSHG